MKILIVGPIEIIKANYGILVIYLIYLNISNLKKVLIINETIPEFVFKFAKEMRTSFRVHKHKNNTSR